jgi:hypothetical protein
VSDAIYILAGLACIAAALGLALLLTRPVDHERDDL